MQLMVQENLEKAMKDLKEVIRELEECIRYCEVQNGISECKNCGLNREIINKLK